MHAELLCGHALLSITRLLSPLPLARPSLQARDVERHRGARRQNPNPGISGLWPVVVGCRYYCPPFHQRCFPSFCSVKGTKPTCGYHSFSDIAQSVFVFCAPLWRLEHVPFKGSAVGHLVSTARERGCFLGTVLYVFRVSLHAPPREFSRCVKAGNDH